MIIRFRISSVVKITSLLLTISLLFVVGFFAYNQYQKATAAWNDNSTWENPQLSFPGSDEWLNGTFQRDNAEGKLSYHSEYCTLYSVKNSDKEIKYLCTLLPYNHIKERGMDPALSKVGGIEIKPDITFTYNKDSDPFPTQYLDTVIMSADSFSSDSESKPTPVKMSFEFSFTPPQYDFVKLIEHYLTVLAGKKTPLAVKLLSWKVEKIPTADEYFKDATQSQYKEFLKKWADDAYADIEKLFQVDKYIKDNKKEEVVSTMRNEFLLSELICATKNGQLTCEKQLAADAPTNFLLYLYSTGYKDKNKFQLYRDGLNAKFFPFAPPVADSGGKVINTFNFETYPVCPIVELTMGKTDSVQVVFFKDFYMRYGLRASLDPQIMNAEKINQAKLSSTSEFYSGTPSRLVDVLCDQFITNHEKPMKSGTHHNSLADENERTQLMTLLATRFGVMFEGTNISSKTATGQINSVSYPNSEWVEAMAKRIYGEAYLQPYKNHFLQIDPEIRKRDDLQFPQNIQRYTVDKDIIRTLLVMETTYAIQ